jgi:phosphatidylserine decarboxylase
LAWLNFDLPIFQNHKAACRFARRLGVDLTEACRPANGFATPRQVFERQIRFSEHRPMSEKEKDVVSPADSRFLAGSFESGNMLFIKEKFFDFKELIGENKHRWLSAFTNGDWAVFRLTPDLYHYNHVPASGVVKDHYATAGACSPCNPTAVMNMVTPFSKNKRVVTVLDTDVPGGAGIGLVAMIEIAALMIGDIVQCYSEDGYENPVQIEPGMFMKKGGVKSMYRPGGSTDVLVFQKNRVRFSPDLMFNLTRKDVNSRFSEGLGKPLVETEVRVRQTIGKANKKGEYGK